MQAIVVTSCTNRKRRPPAPGLRACDLLSGSLEEVADEWIRRVAATRDRVPAEHLYCGRAFRDSVRAATRAQAPLYVVSAGLGVLAADVRVPGYSLTIVPRSPDSVLERIGACPAGEWWREVQRRSPHATSLAAVAARFPRVPILFVLPSLYLAMIVGELQHLPGEARSRLRVLGRGASARLDPSLRRFVMPYDGRLDGEGSAWRGTQADFAARAARHFVETILAADPDGSAEAHAGAVEAALASWTHPSVPRRSRLRDAEIRDLIGAYWDEAGGRASRMLRLLRDEVFVACEQGRFRDLFRTVKCERESLT